MTDGLLDRARELTEREETWLDQDPDVAWRAQTRDENPNEYDSTLALYRQLYEDAGWERCYHQGSRAGTFHYKVKVGGGRYRGLCERTAEILSERHEVLDTETFDSIVQDSDEMQLWAWWEDLSYDVAELTGVDRRDFKLWQCGRSGGYVQTDSHSLTYNPEAMVKLAAWLAEDRKSVV